MITYLYVSLIFSTSLIFCSQNSTKPLVRRSFDTIYQQLNYQIRFSENIDLWAGKQISPVLGPVYCAKYSDGVEPEERARDIFKKLEELYSEQAEHKDEKE